jgi:ubiquinone biosynthesis protein UbiJ
LFFRLGAAALNHLIESENWARDRLRPFAGRLIRIEAGGLCGGFRVSNDGTLADASDRAADADVVIQIPSEAAAKLPGGLAGLFGTARVSGSAELAEAFGFVLRNLRWDAEADLARLVGDIAAHRIVSGAGAFRDRLALASQRLTANVVEAAVEEFQWVVKPEDAAGFCSEVDRLRDDLARLEARIDRLSR